MSRFRPRNTSYWLAQICESNFGKLTRLIPDLSRLDGDTIAFSSFGKPALQLTVVERSRYTVTVDLNYRFGDQQRHTSEPRFRIRIYLDGKCAEALNRHRPEEPIRFSTDASASCLQILEEKWALNYFLERWLDHCLNSQYRFEPLARSKAPSICA